MYCKLCHLSYMMVEGFAGCWNGTGISISLYSFVPIDIYSVRLYELVQDLSFYALSLKLNMSVDSNFTRPKVRENLTNHRFIILTHTHGFYRTYYMTTKGHQHMIYLNEYLSKIYFFSRHKNKKSSQSISYNSDSSFD